MKIISLGLMFFFIGCSNVSNTPKTLDTKEIHLTTIRWGADDLQEIAQKIVSDILSSDGIDFSKTYSFGKIRNDSYDHIDTKHLKNKITTLLIQSNKIKIVENKHQSDAIFYGKISSIFKKNDKIKDMYFNFNLALTDIETTTVIWSGDVEIRKKREKEMIGW